MFPFHCDNPTYRTAFITWAIIGINVAIFIGFLRMNPYDREFAVQKRGFIPARVGLALKGESLEVSRKLLVQQNPPHGPIGVAIQKVQLPASRGAILLSVFRSMFMHGGWWHLIGNMWFLALFGPSLEDRLGSIPFLLFYLVGGFIAAACHWAIDPTSVTPVIGASGAVAAVLGGYAITWPWVRVQTLIFLVFFITIIDVPALFVLGAWFLIQLIQGHDQLSLQTTGGVAWWAHVGGFLVGMGMMPLLCLIIKERKPDVEEESEEETESV